MATSTEQQLAGSTPEEAAALERLYADFATAHMAPLWTQRDDLMPMAPQSDAVPMLWRWSALYPLAERSGELVPVGRGGERRAIALGQWWRLITAGFLHGGLLHDGGLRGGRRSLSRLCIEADCLRFRLFENFVEFFLVLEEEIRNVEKGISVEADVHECRLHPGQHPADSPFIDSSYQPHIRISLKIHFHQLVVFHDGQLRLVRRRRDIDLL